MAFLYPKYPGKTLIYYLMFKIKFPTKDPHSTLLNFVNLWDVCDVLEKSNYMRNPKLCPAQVMLSRGEAAQYCPL